MLLSSKDASTAVDHLARAAHQMIPTAAGAGVSLLDEDGTRVSTAATDTAVEAADAAQYALGQGPCLSAWATGAAQRIQDTAAEARWPAWSGAAADAGIRSVLSVPLVHHGASPGAMKVYATTPAAFGDAEEKLLVQLAVAAATLFGTAQAPAAPVRLSTALKKALATRETIGLATGILMARGDLHPETARAALLEKAQTEGRRVSEIAAEVLSGEHHHDEQRS